MTLLPWKRSSAPPPIEPPRFDSLALPLIPSLHNLARWLTRNPADAEDLLQETFLKALRGYSSFEQGTNFKAWIFRILRNTYLTSRSGLAVQRTMFLEDDVALTPVDHQTPETNLMLLSDRASIEAAMGALPPPLLEVILLCDVEELKYKEIAAILDIPIGTVMSRIARARGALRATLELTYTRESRA
jgi:RNA polymerase sigma-70 factor (ECF subfamily)